MKLFNVKLLTITCEILAQKNILEILDKHEITGYTTYEVEGNGARGIRGQGLKNEKNVKDEVIMRKEKLSDIVEEISRTLFANFAIVLYVTDVVWLDPKNSSNKNHLNIKLEFFCLHL